MSERTASVNGVILRGFLSVNLPLLFIIVGVPLLISKLIAGVWAENSIIGVSLVPSIILAWIWWAYSLPKWRLWAVHSVEDVNKLINDSIAIGLMWPPGHFFQRTEINPKGKKEELRKVLESKMDLTDQYNVQLINDLTKE